MKLNEFMDAPSIINESELIYDDSTVELELTTLLDCYDDLLAARVRYEYKTVRTIFGKLKRIAFDRYVEQRTKRVAKKRLVKKYVLFIVPNGYYRPRHIAQEVLWDEKRKEFFDVILKEDDKYYYVSDSYTLDI